MESSYRHSLYDVRQRQRGAQPGGVGWVADIQDRQAAAFPDESQVSGKGNGAHLPANAVDQVDVRGRRLRSPYWPGKAGWGF